MKKTKLTLIALSIMAMSSVSMASSLVKDAGKTSDLYRNNIQSQLDREVDLRDRDAGVGVYADQGLGQGGNIFSLGVQGAYKIQDEISVGGAIQMPANTKLSGDYTSKGNSNPNFSLYTKYQENLDGTGINAKLSGAYGYQRIGVKPFDSEANSKIHAYGFKAQAGYGFAYGEAVLTPYTGLEYTNVRQNSYRTSDVYFGKFTEERTSMKFGVTGVYTLNPTLKLDADAGVNANLGTHRNDFKAVSANGVYTESSSDDKLQPYLSVGMTADIDRDSSIRVSGDINRQSYDTTAGSVGVAYQYRF